MNVVRVGWRVGEVAARGDGDAAMRRDLGEKVYSCKIVYSQR